MKACSFCGEHKPLTDYHKNSGKKDGHSTRCKACTRDANKMWRAKNADHCKEVSKAYYENNKLRLLDAHKAYYKANAKQIYECNKRYAKANPEKRRKYAKSRAESNPAKVKEATKNRIDSVARSYAATLLKMPASQITEEILQTKRDQIALRRLARLLKEASNENQ